MKIFSRLFFSMESMLVMLIIFALSIGAATFIENDFGTQTARAAVYNARWFELLLTLLSANLITNIFRYKLWRRAKLLSLLFHVAFLVIYIGAGITRFIGYEGLMHIREGGTSDTLSSSREYLQMTVSSGGSEHFYEKPLLLSALSKNHFKEKLSAGDQTITVACKEFIINAEQAISQGETGEPILSMMVSDHGRRQDVIMRETDELRIADGAIVFDENTGQMPPTIHIRMKDNSLYMTPLFEMNRMSMADQSTNVLKAGVEQEFETMYLYSMGELSLVLRDYSSKGTIKAVPVSTDHGGTDLNNSLHAMILNVSTGGQSREVTLWAGQGMEGDVQTVSLGDTKLTLSYGPKNVPIPFTLKLVDFQLDRYPGSNSPSSYASEVVLLDKQKGIEEPFRIYMNHILNHRGFRFFQSSYDQDEKGTVLSASYDPGTKVTYAGYVLLALGLFLNLANPKSRFRMLGRMVSRVQQERLAPSTAKTPKKKIAATSVAALVATLLLFNPQPGQAAPQQQVIDVVKAIDYGHARKFGRLLLQDSQGRTKPLDSMAHEVLNKVARADEFLGLHPDQIALGMFIVPDYWQQIPMIKIKSPEIKSRLGLDAGEKYASFLDFFDPHNGQYKLSGQVDQATRKRPAMQDELDKELLKVDEKLNICYMVYVGELFRIIPKQNDPNNTWVSYMSVVHAVQAQETGLVRSLMNSYINAVNNAIRDGNWGTADAALAEVKAYQEKYGAAILPSSSKQIAEIFFNDSKFFERLMPLYSLIGLALLVLSFAKILKPRLNLTLAMQVAVVLLFAGFLIHAVALGLRWYVSGHAPWSNGYESMIYIAWATLLAGIIFSRKSTMTLAATGILSGLILFVAHLSWMDPQITNLVPVLKSYWLTIHVSMITASYGFLGLGALLAFITLILFVVKKKQNSASLELSIKELTLINEMTLTIGLMLITVGNFLGAVWANESWGRYWGWDPKETWAMVTILIYAAVVHLRIIPKLKSFYLFNVAALLAFSSVIMTYFGVNYYLSGLHSYAKGDPVPIPSFVYYTVATVGMVIALSFRNRKVSIE
jgi:cytochrome c-type biogenesis protein CcsB